MLAKTQSRNSENWKEGWILSAPVEKLYVQLKLSILLLKEEKEAESW